MPSLREQIDAVHRQLRRLRAKDRWLRALLLRELARLEAGDAEQDVRRRQGNDR